MKPVLKCKGLSADLLALNVCCVKGISFRNRTNFSVSGSVLLFSILFFSPSVCRRFVFHYIHFVLSVWSYPRSQLTIVYYIRVFRKLADVSPNGTFLFFSQYLYIKVYYPGDEL